MSATFPTFNPFGRDIPELPPSSKRRTKQAKPVSQSKPEPPRAQPIVIQPKDASELCFPYTAMVGSLGDFARIMAAETEVPPEFYFAAGLTFAGATCATTVKLHAGIDCEPRLNTVLLGESAAVKKSTALRRTSDFFKRVWAGLPSQPTVLSGVGSAEGLARKLTEVKNVVLMFDELLSLVKKAKAESSVLLPMVTSLFEQTDWENAVKNPEQSFSVKNGHLSLISCCTTGTYADMWTSEAIAIGLPNRLFVVAADARPKVAWPKPPDQTALANVVFRLANQLSQCRTFEIEPNAKEAWERWYHELPSSLHTLRLDSIGFRLLMLIALTTDKTTIDLSTVQTVISILDYEHRVRIVTDPIDAENTIAKMETAIRRQLEAKGALTKRELRQHTNADRIGIWAFEKALQNVQTAGDIKLRDGRYLVMSLVCA